MPGKVTLDDFLDDAIETIEKEGRRAVDDTVVDIAESSAAVAPVDTGCLQATIYAVKTTDDVEKAHADAVDRGREKNPKAEFEAAPGVDTFDDQGLFVGLVDVAAAYGPIVHNGYGNREGKPFLEEEGNAAADAFEGRLDRIAAQFSSK